MSTEISYDPNSSPVSGIVTVGPHLVDVPTGLPNTLNNPNLTAVAGLDQKYWKVSNGVVIAMSAQEKSDFDAAQAAAQALVIRSDAKNFIVGFSSEPLVLRAIADTIKDEINLLREWIVAFKAAVAAASSLANLQTRVAALSDMPDRTLTQFKTAINGKVDGGTIDS